jgi:hypothetical protein
VVKTGKGAPRGAKTKAAKTPKGDGVWQATMGGRVSSHSPAGLDVDGVLTPLEGEPPIAHSNGWGNLYWGHYGR